MIAPLLFLAVLSGAQPSPAPSATPQPQLKEIIHVRASPLCTEFAHHANNAIDSATRNDIALGSLIGSLRSGQLDKNEIAHNNAIRSLNDYADAITKDWKVGEAEVSALRKLSESAKDPAQKKELKESADALGGALWRQRKVARDLDGFVAYLRARDMSTVDGSMASMNVALFGNADPKEAAREGGAGDTAHRNPQMFSNPGLANEQDLPPMSEQAKDAAFEFEGRIPDIVKDEIRAAEHVETVSENC